MEFFLLVLGVVALLGLLGYAGYRVLKRKRAGARASKAGRGDADFKVSYAPSKFEWSGNSIGDLPVKTLTYHQYECLEDARYGFKIVGLPPTERKREQPHKTRAHGLKTVASLSKHGFLLATGDGSYIITDQGLNALEVCSVRY